jgi:hypothetical protein
MVLQIPVAVAVAAEMQQVQQIIMVDLVVQEL